MYTSLDDGEKGGGVGEGDEVGTEMGEAMEEAEGDHVGSGMGNEMETEETAEERSTALHGFIRWGVDMIRTAGLTVVDVIVRIATAPFGRVETSEKTCPVSKKYSPLKLHRSSSVMYAESLSISDVPKPC